MFVSKLYIQNYRCFGEEPAVINFSETGIMAFVGCNNAGKSTALKVLDILLGDKWPTGQFSEDDFYKKDHDRKILLACQFFEPISIQPSKSSSDEIYINGLEVEVEYLDSGYGQYSTEVNFHLIKTINEFEVGDWEIACYGRSDKQIFISQEIRNRLPIAITIPLIKLQSEQPTNKWGVLGRMLQKIENVFSKDNEKKNRFKDKISDAVGVLREPEEFGTLEEDIKKFWNSIRPNNLSGTALEFLDYDPWHYYRQFRLAITKNGEDVPLDSLGEGVQRLAVIALYRSYLNAHSRSQKALLLIEEPESYLHPQARSVVYQTLRKAVEKESGVEGQIVYTTHSSDFLDCAFYEEIAIFSESPDGSLLRQVNREQIMDQTKALIGINPEDQVDPRIYYRLVEVDSVGLKDSLFGSRAIIVEGSTDYEFFRAFSDINEKQLSIIIAGGKANIAPIYSFLTVFGIPSLICIDRDTSDNISNSEIVSLVNHVKINQLTDTDSEINADSIDALNDGEKMVQRNLLVFSKNLESFLGSYIPDYLNLSTSLKTNLNLGSSKPKLMFSVGLCSKNKIEGVDLTLEQKKAFSLITSDLNIFLKQELKKPLLIE